MTYLLTSESVTEWHPDKLCDQISDAVLDACLAQDPTSRVACETFATTNTIVLGGEITTQAHINFDELVRKTILDIGYTWPETSFDGNECNIDNHIHAQSPDIAQWVDTWWAGDQGIMFGYATNETDNYLPLSISLAHQLAWRLAEVRKANEIDFLYPDGKTQVTIEYDSTSHKPIRVHTVVISAQHHEWVDQETLKQALLEKVITPIVWDLLDDNTILHINPTGKFVIGGPYGDCWLTGRKIIIDTYGWVGRHWGWAFSWKDPTKVDRSAAYMARWLAKNIVAAWLAERCEIQLSYAIWVAEPVSLFLETFWTEKKDKEHILHHITSTIDLTPAGIIKRFDLRRPIYQQTAAYGHFWKANLPWEQIDSMLFDAV